MTSDYKYSQSDLDAIAKEFSKRYFREMRKLLKKDDLQYFGSRVVMYLEDEFLET